MYDLQSSASGARELQSKCELVFIKPSAGLIRKGRWRLTPPGGRRSLPMYDLRFGKFPRLRANLAKQMRA